MFKRFMMAVSKIIFGDPEDYSRFEYRCTHCGATKESIWTEGCKAMEPCTTAPLALVEKRK